MTSKLKQMCGHFELAVFTCTLEAEVRNFTNNEMKHWCHLRWTIISTVIKYFSGKIWSITLVGDPHICYSIAYKPNPNGYPPCKYKMLLRYWRSHSSRQAFLQNWNLYFSQTVQHISKCVEYKIFLVITFNCTEDLSYKVAGFYTRNHLKQELEFVWGYVDIHINSILMPTVCICKSTNKL